MFAIIAVVLPTAASAQSGATLEVQANAAAQTLLRSAETRLAGNDAAGAWELLSPREAELAGNPYFDYLLGVAALDTGRTSEAIFSLQRALAVEPGFSGARMEARIRRPACATYSISISPPSTHARRGGVRASHPSLKSRPATTAMPTALPRITSSLALH